MLKKFVITLISLCVLMLIVVASSNAYTEITDLNALDESRYPGYRTLVENLKNQYGDKYNFKFAITGLDFDEAIRYEYQGHAYSPKNLYSEGANYGGKWRCPICGDQVFDNSAHCASKEAIAYMLDPRNSINSDSIFQFYDITGSNVSIDDIRRVVQGTFLNDEECIQAIYDGSKTYNINGLFIVSKIIIEQGTNGSSLTKGQGDLSGNNVGYYNFFNIRASGNGAAQIIANGLQYAHDRGWNTKRQSIIDGIQLLKESYVDIYGQINAYFIKFNTVGKEAYGSHQYAQNVMAAENEGRKMKRYVESSSQAQYTFVIPVYENMPQASSARPDVNTPSSIRYEIGEIKNISKSLKVRFNPSINASVIGSVTNGEQVKIIERASSQSAEGYYWDLIVTSTGVYGYASRINGGDECIVGTGRYVNYNSPTTTPTDNPNSLGDEQIVVAGGVMHMTPGVTIENLRTQYPDIVVTDNKGAVVTTGLVGTGYIAQFNGTTITISKRGDIDGDAKMSIVDVIMLLNYVKKTFNPTDLAVLNACRVNNSNDISIVDVVLLLNVVKGNAHLSL